MRSISPLGVSPVVEDSLAHEIDAASRDQARAMRADGEAPETVDPEILARDALRELVGLGPFGPLLEDDQATEVHVPRADVVLALRDGQLALLDCLHERGSAGSRHHPSGPPVGRAGGTG